MLRIGEIIWESYKKNLDMFSDKDRINARAALDIYGVEVNSPVLLYQFDYGPNNIVELSDRHQRHLVEIDRLKARVKRFGEFIELLETFGSRTVVQLNPQWWLAEDAAETITRTINPHAISTYRRIHEALVAYFDELGKKEPDWPKITKAAHQVAYTIAPDEWRRAGVSVPEDVVSLDKLGTRWYLDAILAKPPKSTN